MSEQEPAQSTQSKEVSKGRKIFSGVMLIGVLIVLGIEGRAGFSHSSATKSLQELAPDGVFKPGTVTEAEVEALLSLSPKKEELKGELKGEFQHNRVEYKYSWKSLLRPLMSDMPTTELYVAYTNPADGPRYAMYYGTDKPQPRTVGAASAEEDDHHHEDEDHADHDDVEDADAEDDKDAQTSSDG